MELVAFSKLPFHGIRPGTPLRVEVKNDIYCEPVNQRSHGMILARIGLGMEISRRLEGYWYVESDSRLLRRKPLTDGGMFTTHLDVSVDLARMSLVEVCELHTLLTRFFENYQMIGKQ